MELEKKREVLYKNGERIMHTFSTLGGDDRNRIFGKYLDIAEFMKNKDKDTEVINFIKKDVNILDFNSEVLKASCPAIETKDVPAFELDDVFQELNDFILTGGLKN